MDEITSNMFLKPIISTFAKLSTLLRMFSANWGVSQSLCKPPN